MLMRRPVSWPYSSIGKSLMTILPSCMVISGVNVHLPEQNRRFIGLKRNLSAMPDQVISSDERGRSSKEGHLRKMYCVAKSRSLHWSGVSESLRSLMEAMSRAQYDSFCHASSSNSPGRVGSDLMRSEEHT